MVVISCIHLDKLPIPVPIHDMFDTYHVEFLTTAGLMSDQTDHPSGSQQFVTGQTVHQYGELHPIQFVVHRFTTSSYLPASENQKVLAYQYKSSMTTQSPTVQAFNSCQFQSSAELFQGQLQLQPHTSSHVALDQQKKCQQSGPSSRAVFLPATVLGMVVQPCKK